MACPPPWPGRSPGSASSAAGWCSGRQLAASRWRGLTTAAALFAAAGIGAAAGQGRLLVAGVATAVAVVTLEIRHVWPLGLLDARRWAGRFRDDETSVGPGAIRVAARGTLSYPTPPHRLPPAGPRTAPASAAGPGTVRRSRSCWAGQVHGGRSSSTAGAVGRSCPECADRPDQSCPGLDRLPASAGAQRRCWGARRAGGLS